MHLLMSISRYNESMIHIRPYIKSDRPMVRKICCDTADKGGDIENIFPNRELAADILTSYYTDYEPESLFVAESNGQVIGYVQGCLNNRRYGLALMFLVLPVFVLKGLFLGVFFQKEFFHFMKGICKNWKLLFKWRKESFHSHQGHLHIGVSQGYRGQKIGQRLIEKFLEYARGKEIEEVSASVHDKNPAACRFFERLGFANKGQSPMVMAHGNSFQEYHSISYVKTIV
jgi:ribosomal protein S18 acetylase RimI-like enzyme